jgi:hypothetical protein
MAPATCRFCDCKDDSIQVICENRCLICSRCQLVPTVRKLLMDHTFLVDVLSSAYPLAMGSTPAGLQSPSLASQVRTILKGHCPICESVMCATMLGQIGTFKELYRKEDEGDKAVSTLST